MQSTGYSSPCLISSIRICSEAKRTVLTECPKLTMMAPFSFFMMSGRAAKRGIVYSNSDSYMSYEQQKSTRFPSSHVDSAMSRGTFFRNSTTVCEESRATSEEDERRA